jgi:uncharacterized protein (DUF2062 family)
MKDGFLHRHLVHPVLELLKQGVTPEKMALSLSLGVVLGVIPAPGWTTALCAMAALALGLNLAAIQIVNYFIYPLQLALILPFFRVGEKLFHAQHLPLSLAQIYAAIHTNIWGAMRFLWTTVWHAVVVWALAAPFVVAILYSILVPILRRALARPVAEKRG